MQPVHHMPQPAEHRIVRGGILLQQSQHRRAGEVVCSLDYQRSHWKVLPILFLDEVVDLGFEACTDGQC